MRSRTVSLFVAAFVASVLSQTNVVDIGYTQYQGTFDAHSNLTSFLGIRYAAPPTGPLRWRPPQAPATLAGVQKADSEPLQCLQGSLGSSQSSSYQNFNKRAVTQSEDCLFLNVFVPGTVSSNSRMPVVVWIHGGGYVFGGAAGYDGALVQEGDGGLISVTIQYRLGIFGFLPGAQVKDHGVLNAGLLDQQFALQWVHDHIISFGGDPSKVTIWGQSSGAGSVLQHIVANGGHTSPPLFRAVMTSSTYLPQQYNYNDTIPETVYVNAVQLSNCTSFQDTMSCLRAVDVDTLSRVNNILGAGGFYGTSTFVPVIDGTFIVESPAVTLRRGNINGNVLLAMTNTFEGRNFVSPPISNIGSYVTKLFPNFNREQVGAVVAKYTGVASLPSALDQAIAIMGEALFICPSYLLLGAFIDKGFKGQFAVPPANHGQDIELYFPSAAESAPLDPSLTKSFSQSFLAVVKFMDPNAKFDTADITPHWPPWSSDSAEIVFNVTEKGEAAISRITTDLGLHERCDFWHTVI